MFNVYIKPYGYDRPKKANKMASISWTLILGLSGFFAILLFGSNIFCKELTRRATSVAS